MKVLLRAVCVVPEMDGEFTFTNPASDTGDVRVGLTAHSTAIALLSAPPRPGAPAEYPLGEGYRVVFPAEEVPMLVSWGLIQFHVIEPEGTDVRARLHDGTDEFYYDGVEWTEVVDEDADWNTLQEVKENLAEWEPVLLGLVFELSTTDRFATPVVQGFRFTYEVDLVSEFNDWIYNALVGPLQDELRPEHDIMVTAEASTSLDFGAIRTACEETWNLVEPVAIYNQTTDPRHRSDLLLAYDSGTGIATLSSSPAAGDKLIVRSTYAPVIAVTTDVDYTELASVPAVLFDRIRMVRVARASVGDHIMDVFVDPPVGMIFPAPERCDLAIDLAVWAPLAVDRGRLADAVTRFLRERSVLTSPTTGERCSLQMEDPALQADGGVDRDGLRDGTLSFRLWNVYIHHLPPLVAGDGQPGSASAFGVSVVQAGVQVGDTTVTIDIEES